MKRVLFVSAAAVCASLSALEFNIEKDIAYRDAAALAREGAYAAEKCKLDVKWPAGATNFATVVNLHGGGLVAGNKHFAPWPAEAKDQDPVAFVAAGYRLIKDDKATPEQCVADAAAAVAWTLKNIARYGGDPKKVFVTGISGGGYLTAMVGLDPKWLGAHGLAPTDLCGIAPLTGQMTKHFNVRKVGFKDDDPQFVPKIDAWAPLAWAAKDGVPPACFLTGGRDVEWKARVEENELLAASMRALGNRRVEFHETEGDHGGGVTPSARFLRDFVLRTCDAGAVAEFAPGERLVFLGDSITHAAKYVAYLQLFASLRRPGWDVRCITSGISGDSAGGGLSRWGWDTAKQKPDRVFVMFGMNDVGRDNWKEIAAGEEWRLKKREASLAAYAKNSRALAEKIGASGVKRVWITPSPFDQYSAMERENIPHCNEPGLARCAEAVRALAAEKNLGTVEFHQPMTELLKAHPELRLCGGDRIHPGEAGHLVMAALVLDAMHVSPLVARACVDAAALKADRVCDKGTRNAAVTRVTGRPDGGVGFVYAPKALPFPKLPEYEADEKIYPLTEKLNQEIVCVRNLKPGTWTLAFDGARAGSFTAEELAAGVNVALLDTPNQRTAQETAKLAAALAGNENARRNIVHNHMRFRAAKVPLTDAAAQDAYLDKQLAQMKAQKSPWYNAHVNIAERYKKNRARAKEFDAKAEELYARMNAVRPAVCYVTVTRDDGAK